MSQPKLKPRVRFALAADRMLPHFRGKKRLLLALLANGGISRVPLGKHPVELDLSDRFEAMAALRVFQSDLIQELQRHLRPGDCFADCGANVGILSMNMAGHLGAKGQIYGFEPDPRIFPRLKRNFDSVGAGSCSCTATQAALGETEGELDMQLSQQSGWSTLSAEASSVGQAMGAEVVQVARVRVTTLDAFFDTVSRRPDVIKIDVEGWEYEVLRGAERLLRESPPRCIVVEHNKPVLKAMNREFSSVSKFLEAHGYRSGSELSDDVVFVRN